MTEHKKIAVVLFNLGGPDSEAAIKPFLINFFMDPAIIRAPWPVRFLVSRMIARKRSRKEAGNSYAMLGNKSPLLENTRAQASALQNMLNDGSGDTAFTVHVCMNYWHPMADDVVKDVMATNPDQIILLPLYPQFSTTTTASSYAAWQAATAKADMHVPTALVCCYPDQPGFVRASAQNIRVVYDHMRHTHPDLPAPRVLFSAHGLPEKIIRGGDPYQAQCEQSAAAIVQDMNVPNLDWMICYQSRVGPMKWTTPSTEDALKQAAADGVPVVIYPHAFVSEHVETLVEIEHEYRHVAQTLGIPAFARVDTVMVQRDFIAGLADMVRTRVNTIGIASGNNLCQCGPSSTACPMRTAA